MSEGQQQLDTDSKGGNADANTSFGLERSFSHTDEATTTAPALFHKVKNKKSILALTVSNSRIFAGTQGGELLVWLGGHDLC